MPSFEDLPGAEGSVPASTVPGKSPVTLRLDDSVVAWFRHQVRDQIGGDWRGLMEAALRDHVLRDGKVLESLLRKVVREEIAAAGLAARSSVEPAAGQAPTSGQDGSGPV